MSFLRFAEPIRFVDLSQPYFVHFFGFGVLTLRFPLPSTSVDPSPSTVLTSLRSVSRISDLRSLSFLRKRSSSLVGRCKAFDPFFANVADRVLKQGTSETTSTLSRSTRTKIFEMPSPEFNSELQRALVLAELLLRPI